MDNEQIQVRISDSPDRFSKQVYIYQLQGQTLTIYSFDGNGNIIGKRETYSPGAAIPPSFSADGPFITAFISAFMAAGDAQGIERPTESKTKGLYEAQSHHLKDLRFLLKLP